MKMLPKGKYGLEKMSNRDSLYTHIAVGDDKEPLKRILEELNLLRDELERADECIETLQDDIEKLVERWWDNTVMILGLW